MSARPLRCGRISYTNDLPVYAAFDAGAVACPALLVSGVPTALNEKLYAGELDVSPISSFFFGQHADRFLMLPDICIGAHRAVRSIICLSKTSPSGLKGVDIAATTESATGRMLFATICAERYGFVPRYADTADPLAAYLRHAQPSFLIGDRAIDGYLAVPRYEAHDVGELWHQATGLQMAYAVWAVRREVARERCEDVLALASALRDALAWGRSHPDAVVEAAQAARPRPPAFYADYYRALKFEFDTAARAGLQRFFQLAARHGFLPATPSIQFLPEVPTHA